MLSIFYNGTKHTCLHKLNYHPWSPVGSMEWKKYRYWSPFCAAAGQEEIEEYTEIQRETCLFANMSRNIAALVILWSTEAGACSSTTAYYRINI